jgi:hypothetical protein
MDNLPSVRLTWDRSGGAYREARPRRTATPLGGYYLRGPVPLAWLSAAARLPGSALAVGIALWYLAGLRRTRQDLALSSERLQEFGVSRHAKDRALRHLAEAGLVEVARKKGRSPRVTLFAPAEAN